MRARFGLPHGHVSCAVLSSGVSLLFTFIASLVSFPAAAQTGQDDGTLKVIAQIRSVGPHTFEDLIIKCPPNSVPTGISIKPKNQLPPNGLVTYFDRIDQ